MKTYKVPVTIFIKAPSRESAEGTLLGALGYLEDNCGLRCYARLDDGFEETKFNWKSETEIEG